MISEPKTSIRELHPPKGPSESIAISAIRDAQTARLAQCFPSTPNAPGSVKEQTQSEQAIEPGNRTRHTRISHKTASAGPSAADIAEYRVEDRITEHTEDVHLKQSILNETYNHRTGVEPSNNVVKDCVLGHVRARSRV